MGSVTANRSLERVLARHEAELIAEALDELPAVVRALGPRVGISNEGYYLRRVAVFSSADGRAEDLELRQLSIYELAERYPRDKVAY
jgi:hypothetical protein